MSLESLISGMVPILGPADTGNRALHLMEQNHLSQLPIVSNNTFLGLVNEMDVLDWNTPESPLSAADFVNYHSSVFATGHPYDALRLAHQQNLSLVPVVDNLNQYLGSITRDDLLKYLSENSGVDNPGGIIVLEMKAAGYSLTDIARICENENVTIISTQLHNNIATALLEVTLKTNRTDLAAVVASFERHDYIVKEVYGDVASENDTMVNYQNLMNYLSI